MTALNPMMIGVLSTLKMRFRRLHLRHVIDKSDEGKPVVFGTNVLQAMKWALASWNELSAGDHRAQLGADADRGGPRTVAARPPLEP
ncbi:hypothetical protein PINS_up016772 [Pythium insidiosum]|nr:hypothetical protein PINS_up016772 [Pythium insidiosum]